MNKCKKCGTEFEGNWCPNCGTWATEKMCPKCGTKFEGNCCPNCGTWATDEKTCPKCGAKIINDANFCNVCGFSFGSPAPQKQGGGFKEKLAKIGKWIKTHLKIVIPVVVAVLLVIILSCSIPACIKAKDNGTYYKVYEDGEISKKTYFILKSGKWEDEDGESGTYKKDGEKIIFYYTFFGETEEIASGTIKDGILKLETFGGKDVYISEKHKHNYDKYEVNIAVTCTEKGQEIATCACGVKDVKEIPALGGTHNFEWQTTVHPTCKTDGTRVQICSKCSYRGSSEDVPKQHNFINGVCIHCKIIKESSAGLIYTLNSDSSSYSISGKGTCTDTEVIIADIYKGLPVTSIDYGAFRECISFESIIIPDSVTSIGNFAFYNCSGLTSVIIGNRVTSIGSDVFGWCSNLASITIPDSVTSIGREAFEHCSSLTSIVIPDSVISIGTSAFWGCSALTSITIPDSVISIGNGAFNGCGSLTSVTIGNSVNSIGDNAFAYCSSLTSIIIPDSVISIGERAFDGCSSLTIYCEAERKPSGWSSSWNSSNCPVVWGYKGV